VAVIFLDVFMEQALVLRLDDECSLFSRFAFFCDEPTNRAVLEGRRELAFGSLYRPVSYCLRANHNYSLGAVPNSERQEYSKASDNPERKLPHGCTTFIRVV
jgi:hypothetical protein